MLDFKHSQGFSLWRGEKKFKLYPRGMKFGISIHAPDIWERQLAAGGEGEI